MEIWAIPQLFHALIITFIQCFRNWSSRPSQKFIHNNWYTAKLHAIPSKLLKIVPFLCDHPTSSQIHAIFMFFMNVNNLHHKDNTILLWLYRIRSLQISLQQNLYSLERVIRRHRIRNLGSIFTSELTALCPHHSTPSFQKTNILHL